MDPSEHYAHIVGSLLIALAIILMVVMFRAILRYDSFRVVLLFLVIGTGFLGYQEGIASIRPRSERVPSWSDLSV
jgi:hypothetical protein